MTQIAFDQDSVNIDAALVARGLRLLPKTLLERMRDGKITARCERGVEEDAGRFRLTFFHARRRLRLIVDQEGNVLERTVGTGRD
jgi:hypothetical protein